MVLQVPSNQKKGANQAIIQQQYTCVHDMHMRHDTFQHCGECYLQKVKDEIKEALLAASSLESMILELEYLTDHKPESGAKQVALLRQDTGYTIAAAPLEAYTFAQPNTC